MFSKHASELLSNATVCASVDEATKDCDVVVGTTGLWGKADTSFGRRYLIEDAAKRLAHSHGLGIVGLLIGRDDTGLTKDEIAKCDMVAYIGTNPSYPVLNISHALAIMLYALTSEGLRPLYKAGTRAKAAGAETKHLIDTFDSIVDAKRIRNKKAVKEIFRRMLKVSKPDGREIHALITALK
jgi:TrmH family RNA methyltransferase